MSKKNKVSSNKKGKLVNKKPVKKAAAKKSSPKKAQPKKNKPVKKSKPVVKKSVKAKSVKAKKPLKKAPIKKSIVKTKKPIVNVKKAEQANVVKKKTPNTTYIDTVHTKNSFQDAISKKEKQNLPEFTPKIEKVKEKESKNKGTFASTLKQNNKQASILTNTSKVVDSYSIKPEKEPDGKFEMEFVIKVSSELLYEFLTSPSGLSEWFCDDVNIRNGIYTFIWDGQLQQARLLKTIHEQLVRYQWVDKTDGSYFEFKIQRDELTGEISLIITDFASDRGEQESSKRLWTSQIEKLMHVTGSFF